MISFTLGHDEIVVLVGLGVSVVLPILVGLVTTKVTNSGLKAGLLALLSLITGIGTSVVLALQNGTNFNVGTGLVAGLGSFIIAVASHFGLWRATGTTDAVQNVLVTPKNSQPTKESGGTSAGDTAIPVTVTTTPTQDSSTPSS